MRIIFHFVCFSKFDVYIRSMIVVSIFFYFLTFFLFFLIKKTLDQFSVPGFFPVLFWVRKVKRNKVNIEKNRIDYGFFLIFIFLQNKKKDNFMYPTTLIILIYLLFCLFVWRWESNHFWFIYHSFIYSFVIHHINSFLEIVFCHVIV